MENSAYHSNSQFILEDAEKRQSIKQAFSGQLEVSYKSKIAKFADVAAKVEMTVSLSCSHKLGNEFRYS